MNLPKFIIGMKGQFSIKLLEEIRYTLDQGSPVYLVRLWGDTAPCIEEAQNLFPGVRVAALHEDEAPAADAPILVGTLAQTKRIRFAPGSLVALLQADPILGAQDFRADERAFQLFRRYLELCADGTFLIQTGRSAHPVFQDLLAGRDPWPALMEERKEFSYPPYSRIIDIEIHDPSPKRLSLMSTTLVGCLARALRPSPGLGAPVQLEGPFPKGEDGRTLRVILAKDRQFPEQKRVLKETVDAFTREKKYIGFIHLDVDPD